MESLFNVETTQKFIERINRLTPQSQSQWGKMDVAQMFTHCQKPLEIASGHLVTKVNPLIKFLFAKGARKQLFNDPQFKKNLPTFKEAKVVDKRVFDAEKKKLIEMIENFQQKGEAGLIKKTHPFFGDLSAEEWNILQTKHLDHHLRQFGV